MYAASRTASLYLDKKPKTNCCIANHNHFKNKTEKLKFEFHRFHVSWCPKNHAKTETKTLSPTTAKTECQHVGLHVHCRKLQLDIEVPKRAHMPSEHCRVQQRSQEKNDKDLPKNRDRKGQATITVNRQLGSSRPTDWTTAVRKVHVRPSTTCQNSP